MHNFKFDKLRQSFINKDIFSLENESAELLSFLLLTSYLNEKAYYHPLGFIYSKLYEFENMETIRIHIWDKKYYEHKALMDIHNHYYVVNSFLYKGCIINNVFKIDDENGIRYAIYEGAYNQNEDRILKRSLKEINLSLNYKESHCTRQLYQIPIDTIHSGHPVDNNPVCTIVYTGKPGNPTPLVLGSVGGELEYYFPTKIVDNELITKLLNDLILS
ncbi:hypothetical protein [Dyadobacter sp. NIV53]|uniref:hypothetical protein n=1 Tax=Dyadobacter sp. NIV53 TaxID=2861765 RepID=UPI001C88C104|nr:hypothetical protein [Dyadobacter sp. NIV53]